jgi:hypothetical protein
MKKITGWLSFSAAAVPVFAYRGELCLEKPAYQGLQQRRTSPRFQKTLLSAPGPFAVSAHRDGLE